jgi:hypothetical protein
VAAVARRIDYQPQLGAPWFAIVSYPVYYPWRPFEWWYAFDAYAPDLFNEAGAIAAAGGVTGIIVAVIGSLWRARQNRLVTTCGSSRWATRREVEEARLFHPAGVFLGRLGTNYLRHDGAPRTAVPVPTIRDDAVVTRRDQHHTRVETKLLRHTTSRTLTPNSKRPGRRMLLHRAGLPYQHHTADDASPRDKSKNSSSPRCPSRKRNCSKILKTP